MKNLICKIFGHKPVYLMMENGSVYNILIYIYYFGCTRCDKKIRIVLGAKDKELALKEARYIM